MKKNSQAVSVYDECTPSAAGHGTGRMARLMMHMPASTASAAALHHRTWPWPLTVDAPVNGHFLARSSPGAGKSALFHTLIKAALKTERAGGQHDQ